MKTPFLSTLRSCPDLLAPLFGALFLGLSILLVPHDSSMGEVSFMFALFAYLISVGYFIIRVAVPVLFNKKKNPDFGSRQALAVWLGTAFISCFALNRSVNVFDESVLWYSLFVVVFTAAFVMRAVYGQLSPSLRMLLDVLLGCGTWILLYLVVVLTGWYFIGVVGFFLLGISLHVFIPLLMLVFVGSTVVHHFKEKMFRNAYILGLLLGLGVMVVYGAQWLRVSQKMNEVYEQALFNDAEQLPVVLEMAEQVPTDGIAGQFLKTDIVYNTFRQDPFWGLDFENRLNFEDPKRHDPLVTIAANLIGAPSFSRDEQVELLKFLFRARHSTERKFWSGSDIVTDQITYETQLFPRYRLAYTEMLVRMKMQEQKKQRSWTNQQEALYTFYLPEGTAVTSLSLWVKGKEEKSVLTTKSKADSAYNDIVGVEMRDPSVVHWKEGNTITVRVFPVTETEPRQIRIGFTSPLQKIGSTLRYQNIPFDGPDASNADWNIAISTIDEPVALRSSLDLKAEDKKHTYEGRPDATWTVETDVPELNTTPFYFNGYAYSMADAGGQHIPFTGKQVVLDINRTWSSAEVDEVLQSVDHSQAMCWSGKEWVVASDSRFPKLVSLLLENNFSVLPFHHLSSDTSTLVVTKGNVTGPFLEELKDCELGKRTRSYFQEGHRPYVFVLNGESSVFIKTLAELRLIHAATGTGADVKACLQGSFPAAAETDSSVYIPSAGISIRKTVQNDSTLTSDAPDHVMRLFAYNKVLQLIGSAYFDDSYELEEPVRLASEAHVVSPVSSLIVLETQADYERFDIEANKDGLGNASLNNSGAVPEPHEWVLIGVLVLGIGYYLIRKRKWA